MDTQKQLARIETKVNTIVGIATWLLAIVVGLVVYFISADSALATYYGIGAAAAVIGLAQWRMRQIERLFSFGSDEHE